MMFGKGLAALSLAGIAALGMSLPAAASTRAPETYFAIEHEQSNFCIQAGPAFLFISGCTASNSQLYQAEASPAGSQFIQFRSKSHPGECIADPHDTTIVNSGQQQEESLRPVIQPATPPGLRHGKRLPTLSAVSITPRTRTSMGSPV